MARVLVFPADQLISPPTPGVSGPLVAFDPQTGEAEVILEQAILSPDSAAPFEDMLPELPTRPRAAEPYRAVVVPRRVCGFQTREPLRPGARARGTVGVLRPTLMSVPGGLAPHPIRPQLVLTEFPVKVATTGAQTLELARDVLDVDELTMELQVLALSGGSPSVTVELQTGMQVESTAGWVSAGAFTAVTSAPSVQIRAFTGLLRFIRWNVNALAGTSATFFVSGLSRRWSKGS